MRAEEVLTVSVEARGHVRLVRLAGEVDLATVANFEACFETRLETETDLIIDLSELSFMDSSGVAALVKICKRALEEGWTLKGTRSEWHRGERSLDHGRRHHPHHGAVGAALTDVW
jgi:anti-anti-sigma factor